MNNRLGYESTNWPPPPAPMQHMPPGGVMPGAMGGGAGGMDADREARRAKRKRSRWGGSEQEKAFIPGMPTAIPMGLDKNQEEMYLLQLQIEEISRRLRSGDLGIPPNPEDRSPSPEPIYNSDGKRLNTREYRTRKTLEEERHKLITRAGAINQEYKPPPDYKPPVIRVNDKVMIPQELHPDINFVGLLIGPRGNTLKNLEKDTGAKIIIRGKGSVKEGKIGRKDGQPLPGEDEPLHAYVTASNPENVKKAVEKINDIIKQGIEVPEGQNDLRRQQLRELAQLNGTLRENDALGKLKQIQEGQSILTNQIFCSVCGGTGHLSQDCKSKRPGDSLREAMRNAQPMPTAVDRAKMDSEYMSLMAELGEGPPPPKVSNQRMPPGRSHGQGNGAGFNQHQQQMPPWQAGGPGGPNRGGGRQFPALMAPQQSQSGPPHHMSHNSHNQSAPPMQPPSMPGPLGGNSAPWQQQPMAPPPPPPGMASSQQASSSYTPPWQNQQPPPPPSSSSGSGSWGGHPGPVPPPPPASSLPWQQQHNSGGVAPPPPPPSSSYGYGMPPPPPPN